MAFSLCKNWWPFLCRISQPYTQGPFQCLWERDHRFHKKLHHAFVHWPDLILRLILSPSPLLKSIINFMAPIKLSDHCNAQSLVHFIQNLHIFWDLTVLFVLFFGSSSASTLILWGIIEEEETISPIIAKNTFEVCSVPHNSFLARRACRCSVLCATQHMGRWIREVPREARRWSR